MPTVLYNLQAIAERVGVEGKTDSAKRLSSRVIEELAAQAAEGLTGREARRPSGRCAPGTRSSAPTT
jgi:hypothetical protein